MLLEVIATAKGWAKLGTYDDRRGRRAVCSASLEHSEADEAAGELRKSGLRIKLHSQPFQLLTMLLERPSEVVTREEMRRRLWGDGTFVDFDHALNSAVNKIREALNDSASRPRFVETVAGKGYRFIAPVVVAQPGPRMGQALPSAAPAGPPNRQAKAPAPLLRRAPPQLVSALYPR